MIIFFTAFILFSSFSFSCTPPDKEGSLSTSPVISLLGEAKKHTPLVKTFNCLHDGEFIIICVNQELNSGRVISPRRAARIKSEETAALQEFEFESPRSAKLYLKASAIHCAWSSVSEVYP